MQVNAKVLKLTQEQIEKLQKCHKFIFLDVLQIVKGFLVGDRSNSNNSYCIAPLAPSGKCVMGTGYIIGIVNYKRTSLSIYRRR